MLAQEKREKNEVREAHREITRYKTICRESRGMQLWNFLPPPAIVDHETTTTLLIFPSRTITWPLLLLPPPSVVTVIVSFIFASETCWEIPRVVFRDLFMGSPLLM